MTWIPGAEAGVTEDGGYNPAWTHLYVLRETLVKRSQMAWNHTDDRLPTIVSKRVRIRSVNMNMTRRLLIATLQHLQLRPSLQVPVAILETVAHHGEAVAGKVPKGGVKIGSRCLHSLPFSIHVGRCRH